MPCFVSWRRSLSAMFVTIWMCTHEWSLISIRTTAFTFATCHQPLSWSSRLTRSITCASLRFAAHGHADPHLRDRLLRGQPRLALGLRGDAVARSARSVLSDMEDTICPDDVERRRGSGGASAAALIDGHLARRSSNGILRAAPRHGRRDRPRRSRLVRATSRTSTADRARRRATPRSGSGSSTSTRAR